MRRAVFFIGLILIPVIVSAIEDTAGPFENHPEWTTCAVSSECTSIETGCYYWQPVNKKYASLVRSSACAQSVPAGPQPTVSCLDHQCVNDPYTIKYWNRLEGYQKMQPVGTRVQACQQAAGILNQWESDSWTRRYHSVLEKQVGEHKFPDNETLVDAVKAIVPCEELVTWERGQQKWQTIQSKNRSTRRVIVEQVQPDYSLDHLYPSLMNYSEVFQKCGQASSRAGITFWGDMHAAFTLNLDGRIDPASFKASYPAVAYMHPFLECAGTAFKKLSFPFPPDSQPVHVEALIQVQSAQP